MSSAATLDKHNASAPPLPLHYLGDRVLRQSAKRIARVDKSTRQLAQDMLQTMHAESGIGLAAPQVGVNKRVIVIDCEPRNSATPPLVLINPQIQSYSPELCQMEEGCLSVPGVFLNITRPQAIEVKFKDDSGRPRNLNASGLLARAIQHEIDHLEGVMFVDHVSNDLALTETLRKQGFSSRDVRPIEADR